MTAHDPDNWDEAQREQYRRELEAMAELLLDIYLYEHGRNKPKDGVPLTRPEDSRNINRKGPQDQ